MNEREAQDAIDAELNLLLSEMITLTVGKYRHQDPLHTTVEARRDPGGMKFCPGCREIVLGRRIKDLAEVRDDNGVLPSGNRLRREAVLDNLQKRREMEM